MSDIIKGLEQAKWAEDINRRELRERDYCFYNDDHNYLVSDGYVTTYNDNNDLLQTMTAERFLEDLIFRRINYQEAAILRHYIEIDNITRRIIVDRSILFKIPPEIKLVNGSKSQQENLDLLLKQTKFYSILRDIQRLTELHFDLHVIPQVRKKKMCIDFILSQDAFVEQDIDDPTQFTKFFYQVGIRENTVSKDEIIEYVYWDEDGKHKCEVTTEGTIDLDKVEDIPTIYDKDKIIPIVVFRNYIPINTYWSPRTNFLVEKNIIIDLRLTGLNMLEDWNLPQKVRIGMDDTTEGKQGLTFTEDVLRADDESQVGDVKYINPNAPVTDEKDLIEWRKQDVAVSNGLSADSLTGKTFTSGFELFLSKSEIIEKNKEERVYYLNPVKELITNMMIAAKQIGMAFPKKPEISVNFGELIYTQSPEEKERTRAAKKANGTWSAVQSIMEDDPDLDEAAAIKKLAKITAWNKLNAPANPFDEPIIKPEDK